MIPLPHSLMTHLPTVVLASTVGGLAAAPGVPFPIEMTALVMVGLVLRWALGRDSKSHNERDERISSLESRMREVEEEADTQRHLKHALNNQVTAMKTTITMMLPFAKQCTCGTVIPLIPILERLALEVDLTALEEQIAKDESK
jgi:hypothetical protein